MAEMEQLKEIRKDIINLERNMDKKLLEIYRKLQTYIVEIKKEEIVK